MRTRPTHLAALALAFLLLAGTTACTGGGAEAEPTPKMPPTSTSTASTPEPEPWEVKSRAGVKAFLQRYVETYSEAMRTGDTASFRALATNCDGCDQVAEQIEAVYDAGGRITTESRRFAGWSVGEGRDIEKAASAATVAYESTPVTWIRTKGAAPETYPGGKTEQIVSLEWSNDHWTIIDLFPLES